MKKLTAGIFTVMLGLVAVNAANAAIPSTNYVDTKIGDVETAYKAADTALGGRIDGVVTDYQAADTQIRTDFADADTTTLNSAKAYTDELKNGQVETNKQNIASMDTFVAPAVTMKVGETNPTTVTGAINALDARITEKTSGIASEGTVNELTTAVNGLKTTVSGHTTDISGLDDRLTTAETEIDTLQSEMDAVEVKAAANESAITDNAAAILLKASQADLDTAEAAIEQNKTDIATKANKAGYTAGQVVVTDSTGTITTAAEISNTQVAGLGGLATKTTIADADVADGAAIAQSKIAGLTTSLSDLQNTKVTIPTATGADGNYVLTATVVGDQTTYKWESISREEESKEE